MRRSEKPKQAVYLLIAELLRSDRLPPVTLAVVALNTVVYLELLDVAYPALTSVCLSASGILYGRQWPRLVLSAFFHGDDWHLYYNMLSFSLKGRSLERRYGSGYFLLLLGTFTVACGAVYVLLQMAAAALLSGGQQHGMSHLDSCAVGFSGVIFALKVLTTHHLPDGTVYMMHTIPVPSKYAYWAELVAISFLTPNASFAGHLAGIVVGLLYVYGPLRLLLDKLAPREMRRQNNISSDDSDNGQGYRSGYGARDQFRSYGFR